MSLSPRTGWPGADTSADRLAEASNIGPGTYDNLAGLSKLSKAGYTDNTEFVQQQAPFGSQTARVGGHVPKYGPGPGQYTLKGSFKQT